MTENIRAINSLKGTINRLDEEIEDERRTLDSKQHDVTRAEKALKEATDARDIVDKRIRRLQQERGDLQQSVLLLQKADRETAGSKSDHALAGP